jgi:hypothetical protein
MHKLADHDKEQRVNFTTSARNEEGVLHNTWFSEEAHFHIDGVVNKQNVRFWATEHPHQFHERDSYGNKITVWAGISSHGIIRPFFFEDMANSDCYLAMLCNNFMLQLIATGLPISTQ